MFRPARPLVRSGSGVPLILRSRLPPAQYSSARKGRPSMFADFVDLDDVRMMESGDRLGLGAETGKIGFTSHGRPARAFSEQPIG